jgi:hypothetical protein
MRYAMNTGGIFVVHTSRRSTDTTKVEVEICSVDLIDAPKKEREVKDATVD